MKEFWFEIGFVDYYAAYGFTEIVIGTEEQIYDFINSVNEEGDGQEAIIVAKYEVED